MNSLFPFLSRRRPGGLRLSVVLLAGSLAFGCQPGDRAPALPDQVDYNFHIKPIFSDRCYKCHGPDDNVRKANLRLDTQEGAFASSREDSTRRIVVPGNPEASKLIAHITATDPKQVMPPPESNLSLSPHEIALIRAWIRQGATWKPHWAFIPPELPDLPDIEQTAWPGNELDYFVLHKMEQAGFEPSPALAKEKLLRRVTFDLTGLPPEPADIDAFLADERADAYETVVDRLLASPAYGERMTSGWLDIARYADTHGYQDDRPRTMWPWRDWVVGAFNDNLPYDKFIIWQLAGDLLPEATYAQKLATGFNRNHAITQEGGVVPAEYLTEYVADRTNTTATAFLGLTMECARCHDHKFDPILQQDYYQMFAFFNTMEEQAQISYFDLAPEPAMPVEDAELEAQTAHTIARIEAEETLLANRKNPIAPSFVAQRSAFADGINVHASLESDLLAAYALDNLIAGGVRVNTGLEDVLEPPALLEGREGRAVTFDGVNFINLGDAADFDWYDRFSASAWIQPPHGGLEKDAGLLSKRNGEQKRGGYELVLMADRRLLLRLVHDNEHAIEVRTTRTMPIGRWSHVASTYDGSGRASGITLFINGAIQPVTTQQDDLDRQSILNGNDLLLGNWTPRMKVREDIHGFTGGAVDDVRLYTRLLSRLEVQVLAGASPDPAQAPVEELWDYYLTTQDTEALRRVTTLDSLRREHRDIPSVMIMEEAEDVRPTFVLARGAYDAPMDSVGPGTPDAILPFPEDLPPNRLGLARWLVNPRNPLPARVAVNRLWQMIFGMALVHTPEDFGSQGALPSHPELLDYLAVRFIESGWDIKAMLRLMVLSATYRQSADPTPELLAADPDNTLLVRGPKKRLSAEMMRDNALLISGLLVHDLGGPPVRPYQPPGVWKALANQIGENRYRVDPGENLYRRSLYTYWKRTIPPPAMLTFDAAERTICTVERHATSTPLQSLILLNDPQYVEAARVLAENLLAGPAIDAAARIGQAFRAVTSRIPTAQEMDILQSLLTEQTEHFRQHPERAVALLHVGASPQRAALEPVELAALTVVTSSLFNLDEAQFY